MSEIGTILKTGNGRFVFIPNDCSMIPVVATSVHVFVYDLFKETKGKERDFDFEKVPEQVFLEETMFDTRKLIESERETIKKELKVVESCIR